MKTVNVFECIQMDIPNKDEDRVSEVCRILDVINTQIGTLDSQPQVLYNALDGSDIVTPDKEWNIGDHAVCPEPEDGDMWNFGGWVGYIEDIKNGYAELRDGDGDVWTVELERLIEED